MKISPLEQRDIKELVRIGKAWGFGNMISHLESAWVETMMRDYGMSLEDAKKAAYGGQHAYMLGMHLDLMERGEWDETGERYRKPKLGGTDG